MSNSAFERATFKYYIFLMLIYYLFFFTYSLRKDVFITNVLSKIIWLKSDVADIFQ